MKRSWGSLLLSTGEYRGNPMLKHLVIPDLSACLFDRWLRLF
jgi:hemoglobin